jgi:UDP-N-acetylmuramate: L-alanyl-gamma-D-glutamyl-meso-diaminopimelate ligase
MHNLALALHNKGYRVTGSDDEISEPSRSRLEAAGLLPDPMGWDPDRITSELDAVILGMHARADNPELARALELGLKIYSFPEYMYEQTRDKTRVVIAGSHGKTTVTSLIMHVLRRAGMPFDYLVGAQLEGFSTMVGLSDEAKVAIFEGDEYLSSAIDRRPKFLHYKPDIGVITGIAWDHINVFPTFDEYRQSFREFVGQFDEDGTLIYNGTDDELNGILESVRPAARRVPYEIHPYRVSSGSFQLLTDSGPVGVPLMGRHNMENISAARDVCRTLGISDERFYGAIPSFPGAARRLNRILERSDCAVFLDFAHSPSKVRATTQAVSDAFPNRRLVACLELHTFSSLTASFLKLYGGSLNPAHEAAVYFDPHTVEHKRLPRLDPEEVGRAFGGANIRVFTTVRALEDYLEAMEWKGRNLLLMSSGTFSGLDIPALASRLLGVK